MPAIYHLDEHEAFTHRGGVAVSRFAVNVLQEGKEITICPRHDASCVSFNERTIHLPHWHVSNPVHPVLYWLPSLLPPLSYLAICTSLNGKLQPDHLRYTHSRPECAAALATNLRKRTVHLVLLMHSSHLTVQLLGGLNQLRETQIVFCGNLLEGEALAASLRDLQHTQAVYNGAAPEMFRPLGRGHRLIPAVIVKRRLVGYKGVHVPLQSMGILVRRGVNVRFRVAGGSRFGKDTRTRCIKDLRCLNPSTKGLVGFKVADEMVTELQAAKLFSCLPIRQALFPLCPVGRDDHRIACHHVTHRRSSEKRANGRGVLISPHCPEALPGAIDTLANDCPLRKRRKFEAQASVRNDFLWGDTRKQYDQVLRSLSL